MIHMHILHILQILHIYWSLVAFIICSLSFAYFHNFNPIWLQDALLTLIQKTSPPIRKWTMSLLLVMFPAPDSRHGGACQCNHHRSLRLGVKQTCARQCKPLEGLISKMWFEKWTLILGQTPILFRARDVVESREELYLSERQVVLHGLQQKHSRTSHPRQVPSQRLLTYWNALEM